MELVVGRAISLNVVAALIDSVSAIISGDCTCAFDVHSQPSGMHINNFTSPKIIHINVEESRARLVLETTTSKLLKLLLF